MIKELIDSWWVIAFFLLCGILYERALAEQELTYQKLAKQLTQLQEEKMQALKTQENLHRQINSQSDTAWIELTLMKKLGLCPEDYQKVYFTE
jgi:hypothetical protein